MGDQNTGSADAQTETNGAEGVSIFASEGYVRYIYTRVLLDEHGEEWGVVEHSGSGTRYNVETDGSRCRELFSVMAQLGYHLSESYNAFDGERGFIFDTEEKVVEGVDVNAGELLDDLDMGADE